MFHVPAHKSCTAGQFVPAATEKPAPDFLAADHGSIWLVQPITDAAKQWVADHIPSDAQWFGRGFVVEWRFIDDILCGIAADGLEVA